MEKEVKGMKEYSLKDWKAEGKKLFGEKGKNWKWKCPACGNVQTAEDFVKVGLSEGEAMNTAYQECIGRYTGAGSTEKDKQPCNWAAYGLFGTLGKGVIVVTPEGKKLEVFDFAMKEGEGK